MILTEMKNYQLAIEQLNTAVAHPDASPEAYVRLSNAQLLAGYHRQAERTLVAGREAFPDLPMFRELMARAEDHSDGRVTVVR
jgi:hypothetical protein